MGLTRGLIQFQYDCSYAEQFGIGSFLKPYRAYLESNFARAVVTG
jgi:hypothetical protein